MSHCLYLIDGSGFIFRAFHALPPLTTPEGTPIGAVVGFYNMILKLHEDRRPTHWAIVFDTATPTFRHHLFPSYKANRPPPDPQLITQFALVHEACHTLRLPLIQEEGVEADDIIATYTKKALSEGWEVEIVSSDKDMMQLFQKGVTLFDPLKNKLWDKEAIFEKWGVEADRIIDVQALIGDKADNITGVPGVGPKTAAEWIQRFGSLDALLQRIPEIAQPKKRELLEAHAEKVLLYRQLLTLKTDTRVPLTLEETGYQLPDAARLQAFLKCHGLETLKARLIRKGILQEEKDCWKAHPQTSFKEALEKADLTGKIALIPLVTEGVLTGLGWAVEQKAAGTCLLTQQDLEALRVLLESPYVLKVFHDAKAFLSLLPPLSLSAFEDVMILSYLAQAGRGNHSLQEIGQYIGQTDEPLETPQQKAHLLFIAYDPLKKRVQEAQEMTIYTTVDKPCIPVLCEMERAGICLDPERLQQARHQIESSKHALEEKIYADVGHPVVLASSKQVGQLLFEELGWPQGIKGKSGQYLTPSFVLQDYADQGYLLAEDLLAWRHLSKLQSTYTDSLLGHRDPITGRVSTHYSMVSTSTGRLSSIAPNLQNIPLRTPEGKRIRAAFHAAPGFQLISLDYSHIELRLLAHMADVKDLKKAFEKGEDIHTTTAARLFQCMPLQVTEEQRRQAKIMNFGILYGISAMGLSRQLGLSMKEAQGQIDLYFRLYPGIAAYLEETKEKAKTHGYVTTLWGRRCGLPGILSPSYKVRAAAQRQAINAPLQGTSADIMKRAMIHLAKFLKKTRAQLLLQIHDEIVLEAPEEDVSSLIPSLSQILSEAASLSVPLEVNVSSSFYWGET